MVEHIDRYDEFARFLAEKGYYVVGHDHLGHGKSVTSKDKLGFFHESKGNTYVIGDIHRLRKITKKKYKDVPYFMLGHSMGSFLLRQYLGLYGDGISGAIVMGTGSKSNLLLTAGKVLCRITVSYTHLDVYKRQGNKHVIEYSLKLDSNPEFTSSVLVAYARAAYRLSANGECCLLYTSRCV